MVPPSFDQYFGLLERVEDFGVENKVARFIEWDLSEIVVKQGGDSICLFADEAWHEISIGKIDTPIDTTAAGDSFNAAYLAARFEGLSPYESIERAHQLASAVIQYHGAVISAEHMPSQLLKAASQ